MKIRIVCLSLIMVIGTPAYQVLLLDDAPPDHGMPGDNYNLDNVCTILDGMGIGYDHWHNNWILLKSADIEFLRNYDIILWYNDGRAIEQAEYDAMMKWVSESNYLAVTGEDSLGSPNDPLMAALVGSLMYGDYPYCEKVTVTRSENWIMDGPAGFFEGVFDIIPEAHDHDKAAPKLPGTYQVAMTVIGEHIIGPAKILVTENVESVRGGIVVYWNGNWDAVEWWRMSQTPDTVNMFKNMMYYFIETVPENTVEDTSWGVIKGTFAP